MWSTTLRPSTARLIRAPGRALASSFTRGRPSPRSDPRNSIRRSEPIPSASGQHAQSSQPESPNPEASHPNVANYDPSQNTLLSPVHIPEDSNAVLREKHPAARILANSALVVQRQLELMNVMVGFEQANKYVIMDANGNHIGYLAEQEKGMANMMARQWFRAHRNFVTHVFDKHENEVLRFYRPFSYISSRIRVHDPLSIVQSAYSSSTSLQSSPESLVQASGESNARVSPLGVDEMRVVGEAQQQWAPLRRKYNLFTYHHSPNPATDMGSTQLPLSESGLSQSQQMQLTRSGGPGQQQGEYNQFAYVDEQFLSWDFALRSADNKLIGSVNRDFAGFARELFTDTGVYALRMDSAKDTADEQNTISTGMTLDQRAVMLATAVSVDFDYFSRHSSSGGGFGFLPVWIPGVGGEAGGATAGGAAAGEAGAAGAAGAGGVAEGASAGAAGAGTIAGYEAMQRGMYGNSDAQGAPAPEQQQPSSPMDQQPPPQDPYGGSSWGEEQQEDIWDEDPWDGGDGGGGDGGDWF